MNTQGAKERRRKLREAEMSDPVSAWLRDQGLKVYAEVPFYATAIDLVGADMEQPLVVAVEMKMSFSQRVLGQALMAQLTSHRAYACAPTTPGKSAVEFAETHGVGLMRVVGDAVEIIAEPNHKRITNDHHIERLKKVFARLPEGGVGGKPCLRGVGPAVDVERRIAEYREQHPEAKWAEIYANVPNHYANCKSMQGAMLKLRERRAWRERRERAQ